MSSSRRAVSDFFGNSLAGPSGDVDNNSIIRTAIISALKIQHTPGRMLIQEDVPEA
jgi:hypothetical protein